MSEPIWNAVVADLASLHSFAAMATLAQVVVIDVMLAADNAIVIGALAAGLDATRRNLVLLVGTAAALLLRIGFALVATQLMHLTGLALVGGVLLAWVAWKMWRELIAPSTGGAEAPVRRRDGFVAAAWAVALADLSMSLDNVLAVSGAARDHPGILAIGLVLSVGLMGLAATLLARLIERHRWLAFLGLAIIVLVAIKMIWVGAADFY